MSTILIVALVVPGYALLLYIPALVERWDGFVERAIVALGLSVLLTPIFFLAMRLVNLPIGGPLLIALLLASLAAIALKLRLIPQLRSSSVGLTATASSEAGETSPEVQPESRATFYLLSSTITLCAIFMVGLALIC